MLFIKYFLLTAISLLLNANQLFAQDTPKIPKEYCMSQQEYRLFNIINEHRTLRALKHIPLSRSLSYMAQTHASDLAANFPLGENCNMHSWSDKGSWKPFCFPADQNRKNDIKDKAKELTDYPGKAWEITYWENSEADLNFVLEFWNSIPYSSSMINNTDEWSSNEWKSMGIGIKNGYVLVWLGIKEDVEISTTICETGEKIQNKSIPNELVVPTTKAEVDGKYYVIIGSFNKKADAESAVSSYHQMGYPNASIVETNGRIRVSIDSFSNQNEADDSLDKYRAKFQGAWVFSEK